MLEGQHHNEDDEADQPDEDAEAEAEVDDEAENTGKTDTKEDKSIPVSTRDNYYLTVMERPGKWEAYLDSYDNTPIVTGEAQSDILTKVTQYLSQNEATLPYPRPCLLFKLNGQPTNIHSYA